MENEKRITRELGNGFSLCVEASENPDFPNEFYVGLIDEEGVWVQDLVMVLESYGFSKEETHFDPNEVIVSVFGDESSEDPTDEFRIKRYVEPED